MRKNQEPFFSKSFNDGFCNISRFKSSWSQKIVTLTMFA